MTCRARKRRIAQGLMLTGAASLSVVALFQVKILKHLVPKSAERIHSSREAYQFFGVPDGILGAASYAVSALLIGRWPVIATAKLTADNAVAAKLTVDEIRRFHTLSPWALVASACAAIAMPLTISCSLKSK